MSRDIVSAGQIVFDDATDDGRLVVVDPNAGMVVDQDSETTRAIKRAKLNEDYDTSDSAECVDCVYLSDEMSDRVYTFSVDRLNTPDYNKHTLGYAPSVWAKAEMLVRLYKHTELNDIDAMNSDVEGRVILAAKDIMVSEGVPADHAMADGAYDHSEELHECPKCSKSISIREPFESHGGYGHVYIGCDNSDCDWRGREDWKHEGTETKAEDEITP